MFRRHAHARFSPYLAPPMERTLKAYFVFIPFSYCKKINGFGGRPANRYGFFLFACAYIYAHANKKNSICSRFRDTNKVCVKINVGYSKTDTLSVVPINQVARSSKSRCPLL